MPLILLLFLLLAACSPQAPQSPYSDYDNLPVVQYNEAGEDLYLYAPGTQSNVIEVSVGSNETLPLEIKFSSRNRSSEVFKILSSQVANLPQTCAKQYEINDECSLIINLTPDIKASYVVVRSSSSRGLRVLGIKVNRAPGASDSFVLDQSNQVGGAIHSKSKVRKIIGITNNGSGLLTITPSVTGRDHVSTIVSNTCKNVRPRGRCYVAYQIQGGNKSDGVYEDSITLSSGSNTVVMPVNQIQIYNSTTPNNLPVWQSSSFSTSAGEVKNLQLQATDADGDTLSYYFSPPVGLTITNQNINGSFTVAATQEGVYNFEALVSDGKSPAVSRSISVKAYPQMIISNKNFMEGENQDPLFNLALNSSSSPVTSVSTDLKNAFSILSVKGLGSTYTALGEGMISNSLPVISGSSVLSLDFMGSAKNAGSYALRFTVNFQDGSSYVYPVNFNISSSGLPLIKYDVWLVRHPNHTVNQQKNMKNLLFTYIKEMSRSHVGFHTPILTNFRHENLDCGNGNEDLFQDSETQQSCLRSRVSANSETVYAFRATYSGGSEIGGIAQGLRSGVVVSATAGRQTVITHEIGHNLGLWHTHETYFNGYVTHCDGNHNDYNQCSVYNVAYNTTGSASIVGDFSDFLINPDTTSSSFTLAWDYSALDDTTMDWYGIRNVAYRPYCLFGNSACTLLNGYNTIGVPMFLNYGQDSQSVCQQSGDYSVYCSFGYAPLSNGYLSDNIVKNVMSYWNKPASTGVFSPGQRARMNEQLNRYPFLTSP